MPMSTEIKLTKNDEADSVDSSKYRDNPKTTHLEAVKRIFRYIRGTSHLGLWYPKGTEIEILVYVDSNHAGKQTALAISTTEAEYVFAGKACQQALWMKQALIDYFICLDNVSIMCNNKGAIDLNDWSDEWDASNPAFRALFILEDGASVARIWGVKGCTIIAIIFYDLSNLKGKVKSHYPLPSSAVTLWSYLRPCFAKLHPGIRDTESESICERLQRARDNPSEEDPSEEDPMEDDEPFPTQNALTPRIQPSIIRNALLV
ncbi:hypothetical protein Tco_1474338 [Tanacetum coccineum]